MLFFLNEQRIFPLADKLGGIHVDMPVLSGTMWDDAAVYGTNFGMLCDVITQIICGAREWLSEEPFASLCRVEEGGSNCL
jgi:hypothetical protein